MSFVENNYTMIKITECPRDAMQGITTIIPTQDKIKYLNALLKVGFDTLDFGSFVSPRAIPQLSDTAKVLESLDLSNTSTKLLAIIASKKGASIAASYKEIEYLGFPFSFSSTFLKKNINTSIEGAFQLTQDILSICQTNNKKLLQYISMAFGNPYGDPWSIDLLLEWIEKMHLLGIKTITLSDVTGEANPQMIQEIYTTIVPRYPHITFGLHLHTTSATWKAKVDAAYKAGCRSFDTVLNDKGGCPMSGKELLNNLNTYNLIEYASKNAIPLALNLQHLKQALLLSHKIFPEASL